MRLVHGILACVLAFGPLGCGGGEQAADAPIPPAQVSPPEPAPTPDADPPPPEPAAEPAAPAPEPAPAAPGAASAGDPAAGQPLYATYCASCHGATGDGDGPVSAGLNPKPVAHSDAAYMNALSDEYLFRVIDEGGAAVGKSPLMAPWGGTLSDQQIRDVVAYVRTLAE